MTLSYRNFKKDNSTFWHNMPLLYKVTHENGEFFLTSDTGINYKATIELLKKNGYKRPYITYIGHDVTF